MNYLKAIGVLRILADPEHGLDRELRGGWEDGVFLLTTRYSESDVVDFLKNSYKPAPIISPWLGGGGFLSENDAPAKMIERVASSDDERLRPFSECVNGSRSVGILRDFAALREREKILKAKKKLTILEKEEHRSVKARMKRGKEEIIFRLRNELPDAALPWLDTCLSGDSSGIRNSPHAGTGGNIGKLDISSNYLKNVDLLFTNDMRSSKWLQMALTGSSEQPLEKTSVSQFAPGQAGGANSTQGAEGESAINPWDFVLMVEGMLFLAGSLSRKMSAIAGRPSFPFTVSRSTPVGGGPLALGDDAKSKGELWLPLWKRPCSLAECRHLFSEGRAELSGRQSSSGLDFARSIAGLGTDRGINSFVRFVYVEYVRAGLMAIPIGRFDVAERNDAVLFRDIDRWLSALKRFCGDSAPERFHKCLHEVEYAIFEFCQFGGASRFQSVIIAVGKAERLISTAPRSHDRITPVPPLSEMWVSAADDNTAEFQLALALASLNGIRRNLENVEIGKKYAKWSNENQSAVWTAADLTTNLQRILNRRVLDFERSEIISDSSTTSLLASHPLSARHGVSLHIVSALLAGRLDEQRVTDLFWGLSCCKVREYVRPARPNENEDREHLPAPYSLLKQLFHPHTVTQPEQKTLEPDLTVLALLRAHRIGDACVRATRILRGKGRVTKPHPMRGFPSRDSDWAEFNTSTHDPIRLAAALLIPIRSCAALQDQVFRLSKNPETSSPITETTNPVQP